MDQMTIYLGADRIISACGVSTEETFEAILRGKLGVKQICDPKLSPVPLMAGRIDRSGFPNDDQHPFLEQILRSAIESVVGESGVDPKTHRTGLVIATTKGNVESLSESLAPHQRCFIAESMERVAQEMGFAERPVVISNACISGIVALIVARRLMLAGLYDDVIVAGVDVLSEFVVSGFQSFKSVSDQVCKPYDAQRKGLSLGEACGAVVLTKDPMKAKPRPVVLAGGALSEDANHLSAPSRTGAELAQAMTQAMEEAGIEPSQIDFVNAHGTATAYNDEMESKAIYLAGLIDKPLNSLKPYLGHTLGASGIVETILSAEELRQGVLFGTAGFEECGVPHPVNVASEHRHLQMKSALKSGSGFGGCNAAVVLTREKVVSEALTPIQGVMTSAEYSLEGEGDFAERIRAEYKALGRPNMRFFKMDDLEKLGYVAAEKLLADRSLTERYGASRVGIILANHAASLATDCRHQEVVNEHHEEGASPAIFVYTLPNIVAGEISIRYGVKGESIFFVEREMKDSFAEKYARELVACGILDAVLTGWCDYLNGKYSVHFNILEKQ